ncbi:tRNA (adenine(37)-N6)-methyltransferase [Diorhabda sublineata]|uniref:tRNA (adenine(37)-N6)-methyltransferase n=1 Tax=Diorhabda sublineata TaxID=1163346 RepID=UPI0024E14C82|nr:tRNA (adenine(37)-N6)-methyltransferase [Diorhabda sublineata]
MSLDNRNCTVNDSTNITLDPISLQNQLVIARKEINNLRQQLNTLNHVHRNELDHINKKLAEWQCTSCRINRISTQTSSDTERYDFTTKYIGKIITNFPQKRGTPRQPGICKETTAKIVIDNNVFTNPEHALEGLQEYSHMWLIFHFHKNDNTASKAKVAPPRLNGIRTGVFATRSPHRPAPLGLSLVKIDRVMDNVIYFSGVDMINETPVLDIKPYIPQYDNPVYLSTVNSTNRSDTIDNAASTSSISEPSPDEIESGNETNRPVNNERIMDGQENEREQVVDAPVVNNLRCTTEELFYTRSNSRIGEREAPDGEEEESPRISQSAVTSQTATTPEGHIRVPAWIDQPLVPRLTVVFRDRALVQLIQLGPEAEDKKTIISNVLREDPRSKYLRERWGSHCYVFRIADLHVSCKFNDSAHVVTVYQIFQNNPPQADEE